MLRLTARRAAEIEPFEVMDVLARAHALEAAGRRVVHMEIGEPDFTAAAPVVEAGVQAPRGGPAALPGAPRPPRARGAVSRAHGSKVSSPGEAAKNGVPPGGSRG